MLTEPIGDPALHTWVEDVLSRNGFDAGMRGEQIYCVARKGPGGGYGAVSGGDL